MGREPGGRTTGLRRSGQRHRAFRTGETGGRPAALDRAGELCAGNVELIELAIDDSWCRDSGPSFVCHPQLGLAGVSWRFNAWGGKSAYAQDASLARRILDGLGLECFGVPLANEGGAIHVDGEGTLITTESVLLNANRNPGLSKAEIEALFARLLGVTRTIWLPGDPDRVTGDMTDGHVDGVCAFARPGALLLDATSDTTSAYAEVVRENRRALELALDARGRRFELIELFDAGEVAPEEGCSVPPTPISISPMARSSCRPTVSPPTTRPPRPWPGPSRSRGGAGAHRPPGPRRRRRALHHPAAAGLAGAEVSDAPPDPGHYPVRL